MEKELTSEELMEFRRCCLIEGYITKTKAYKCMNKKKDIGKKYLNAFFQWTKEKGSEPLPHEIRTESLFEFLKYKKGIHY